MTATTPLFVRPDGVPWAAQAVEFMPWQARYRWRDCLGRWHQQPARWFEFEMTPGTRCTRSLVMELERRVLEWWRPA